MKLVEKNNDYLFFSLTNTPYSVWYPCFHGFQNQRFWGFSTVPNVPLLKILPIFGYFEFPYNMQFIIRIECKR